MLDERLRTRVIVRGASGEHASRTSVAWCVVGTRWRQAWSEAARGAWRATVGSGCAPDRVGDRGGRREGGGGASRGAWTARLQRTGLRHGLHERLEALDAVLELEAREAEAVEPRLVRVRVSSPYALALALALTLTWQ